MHPIRIPRRAALLPALLLLAAAARAEDWPNWRGPRFDGISRETGLLKSWPAAGPRVLWRRELTGGFSSVSVAQGRLVTQSKDGKQETVFCLDAATGRTLWEYRYEADYDLHPTLDIRFKGGPRSTPTVADGRVYALGTTGLLHCLDLETGRVVWRVDLLRLSGGECPEFGYCNSPLLDGDLLHVQPGGTRGNSLAALDRRTGRVVWTSQDDIIGCSTPILVNAFGSRQLIHFTGRGLAAVTPGEGRLLWRFDWKTEYDLNVATPIHSDGKVFISSNYGKGAALVRLTPNGAEEVYRSLSMQNHFSTSVLLGPHLYGFSNDRLRCVEFDTGKVLWEQRGLGRGALLAADGHLVILGERGDLVLAEASPAEYREKARWKALEGICWTVPVLANGRLYLRNERTLLAVEAAAPVQGRAPAGKEGG